MLIAGSIYLSRNFYHGTSYLFFLPPVLLGMYLLSIGRDRAAVLALCLAATIRPEALIIIAMVIAIRYLRRGDWRKTLEFAGYGAIALLIFVLLAYWTQGSWDRIGGAAATGYPAPASFQTLEHIRVTLGRLFSERFVAPLLLPALFASVRVRRARTYLYFVSTLLAFFVLAVTDFMIIDYRFIAPLQVFIFALGCGGIMRVFADLRRPVLNLPAASTLAIATAVVGLALAAAFWSTRSITTCLLMLAIPTAYLLAAAAKHQFGSDRPLFGCHVAVVLLLVVTSIASAVETQKKFGASLGVQRAAILDALELLSDPQLSPGSAIIAEDELLNYVLVKRPDYLTRARSIQSFNVLTNTQKREALSEAQFLYVSKRPNKGWNYLFYLPKAAWRTDRFRTVVIEMIRTNQPRSIFGSVLEPIHNSNTRFTARILPDPNG